jgi:hypothetical protein
MADVWAVIGQGPNGLEIPLVMFSNKDSADTFVEQFPQEAGRLSDEFSESFGEFDTEEDDHPLYKKLFKDGHYYSGCGGCYRLVVRGVDFGLPMVAWDLD